VPARAARPAPAAARHVEDDRGRLAAAARVILVIEDDVRFAAILRDLAHEMGFQCVVAHSAREGLEAATEYRPSAILLDMNLPDHSTSSSATPRRATSRCTSPPSPTTRSRRWSAAPSAMR
jgi:CheY-like chemotaxis protein